MVEDKMSTTVSYPALNLSIKYTFHDPRTFAAVIFHSVLLRSVALTGVVYLAGIQRLPKPRQAALLLFFLLVPTYPLSLLLCRLVYCLYLAFTQPGPEDRYGTIAYIICATLGLRTWTNGSSIARFVEKGGHISDAPHDVSDNSSSSSLLSGDASEFQRLECTCTDPICRRFDKKSYLHTAAVLAFIFLYCAVSLFIYIRRTSRSYVEMVQYLLEGTPPGRRPADIYSNALETVSTFDHSNAIWATAGLVCSASALVLRLTQWEFDWKDRGSGSDHGVEEPPMVSYAGYTFSFVLYVFFTRQTWSRVFQEWRRSEAMESIPFYSSILFFGMFAISMTHSWMTTKEKTRKETLGKRVLFLWAVYVTFWPVVYSMQDARELVSCVKAGECPYPLFLWKDSWSRYTWIY